MDTSNIITPFLLSFSRHLNISHFPSVYHSIPVFSLSVIFFVTISSISLLHISKYLRVLPNFYCPNDAFPLVFPHPHFVSFSPQLCISVLHSFHPNTFSSASGLTSFLIPYSVLRSLCSISTLNEGNQSYSCGHLAMEVTSASTSFAFPLIPYKQPHRG